MRICLIADVGDERRRHVGDEAMLDANLAGLRRIEPDAEFVLLARHPSWASARFGIPAVETLRFAAGPGAEPAREAQLGALVDASAEETPASRAIAQSDAAVISGGGNLTSSWPDLLFERIAVLELARRFAVPSIVLGQTIGPSLSLVEARVLGKALASARLVVAREMPSALLAAEMGVPVERILYQMDDAAYFAEPVPRSPSGEATIAVTIDPQLRAADPAAFSALAVQLRALQEATRATIDIVPHEFGSADPATPSDAVESDLLADAIGTQPVRVVHGLSAAETRVRTMQAGLVISTRYHPLVFAISAAVPCIGIYGDDYCRIKLQGALAHAGLDHASLTYEAVRKGALHSFALAQWASRDALATAYQQCELRRRRTQELRIVALSAALRGEDARMETRMLFGEAQSLVLERIAQVRRAEKEWEGAQFARLLGHRQTLARYADAIRRRLPFRFTT
jgi:polysaccharide pyruvyl transferase WcaK-like protein